MVGDSKKRAAAVAAPQPSDPVQAASKKPRSAAAAVASSFPQLGDELWKIIIRHLFRFGRRPVVTASVCRSLRACTKKVAEEKITCDAEQLALHTVITKDRGSIMCVVKDAVHLSVPKIKAYPHSQASRRPQGYYLIFPKTSIRQMIIDHGGFDALEARRLKKLSSKRTRVANAQQRTSSRKAELDAALGALGVERRADSRLCEEFLGGKSSLSASEVAGVMARMKWYHKYCKGFIRDLEQAEKDVEEEVERVAAENRDQGRHEYGRSCDAEGFYSGINSECMREVLGTCSWGEFKDDLMARYPVPAKWPWLP